MDITISGTLRYIYNVLRNVLDLAHYHNEMGWEVFQPDEEWLYSIADESACDVCKTFAARVIYHGDEVPTTFPQWYWMDTYVVSPNVHEMGEYAYLHGKCRCFLTMLHPTETAEARFHKEKEALL